MHSRNAVGVHRTVRRPHTAPSAHSAMAQRFFRPAERAASGCRGPGLRRLRSVRAPARVFHQGCAGKYATNYNGGREAGDARTDGRDGRDERGTACGPVPRRPLYRFDDDYSRTSSSRRLPPPAHPSARQPSSPTSPHHHQHHTITIITTLTRIPRAILSSPGLPLRNPTGIH